VKQGYKDGNKKDYLIYLVLLLTTVIALNRLQRYLTFVNDISYS